MTEHQILLSANLNTEGENLGQWKKTLQINVNSLTLNTEIGGDHLTLGPEKSPPVSILRKIGSSIFQEHRLLPKLLSRRSF